MATDVIVPVPDQTTEEVRIVSWKKNVGDLIEKGEYIDAIDKLNKVLDSDPNHSDALYHLALCRYKSS